MNEPPKDAPASQPDRRRLWSLVSLAVVAPVGFYSKFYRGPAADWVNGELGGFFYELFWCLLAALLWPRSRPARIAGAVLVATCLLEFLQLWHPPFLEWVRSFFLGRAIIGNTFDWGDFLWYFLGCGAGWYWLHRIGIYTAVSSVPGASR